MYYEYLTRKTNWWLDDDDHQILQIFFWGKEKLVSSEIR